MASDARLLNDRFEIDYALRQMRGLVATHKDNKIGVQPIDAVFRPGRTWQFVACFSRARDQLSQWRAYGRKVGIAIGFDRTHLTHAVEARRGHAIECRYLAPGEFAEIWAELDPIVSALSAPGSLNSDGKLTNMALQDELSRRAALIASSIKHHSFAEEREVRWPRLSEQFFRVDKWRLCRG